MNQGTGPYQISETNRRRSGELASLIQEGGSGGPDKDLGPHRVSKKDKSGGDG